jgi:hypothetical protein
MLLKPVTTISSAAAASTLSFLPGEGSKMEPVSSQELTEKFLLLER